MDPPYDVWLCIASFISADDLQKLYAVNRALFDIVMNIRYREIDLYSERKVGGIMRNFTALKSQAHRVHTLNLRPSMMADFVLPMAPLTTLPRRERKPILKFFEFVRRSTDSGKSDSLAPILGPNIRRDRCAERMSDVISGMKNVKELNVMDFALSLPKYDSVAISDLDYLLRVALVSARATFGSTLRCLSINLSPPYPLYVFLFDLTFPTLEELDVKLPVTAVQGRLVSFINNHHSTLQSLKLFIVSTSQATGSDPCLSLFGIRQLQHLKKVHFWYNIPARSPLPATSGLDHVLATHSNGIRELRLDLDHCRQSSTKLEAEPLFHVALPHLESLELGSSCFADCKQISVYLTQFTRALMVFNLERTKLPYNDVVVLMNAFPEQNKLRYLTISVEHLTPELLCSQRNYTA